jgi:hypothetical protein
MTDATITAMQPNHPVIVRGRPRSRGHFEYLNWTLTLSLFRLRITHPLNATGPSNCAITAFAATNGISRTTIS